MAAIVVPSFLRVGFIPWIEDRPASFNRNSEQAICPRFPLLAPRLLGYLFRHTRDRARAEDVVQQTMLRIHKARGRFTPGAEVTPWAFAIARRLLIDSHRRGGREVLAQSPDETNAELLVAL